MKEIPILFSTSMVKAILDGRKTQTRRIVKPQSAILSDQMARSLGVQPPFNENTAVIPCPYGNIGDILWVRETWRIIGWWDGDPFTIQYKDGKTMQNVYLPEHRADDYNVQCTIECINAGLVSESDCGFVFTDEDCPTKWRPSIFMPRAACRTQLRIVNRWVERLNDISDIDAIQEGIEYSMNDQPIPYLHEFKDYLRNDFECDAVGSYMTLWESIHGKGSWSKNPWVWVIEFERIN